MLERIIGLLFAGLGAFLIGGVVVVHNPIDVPFWILGVGIALYIGGFVLVWKSW